MKIRSAHCLIAIFLGFVWTEAAAANPAVETLEPDDIASTSALLRGNLTALGAETAVDAFFRYREKSVDGLIFNGSSSEVSFSGLALNNDHVSISMWIKPAFWSTSPSTALQELVFLGVLGAQFEVLYSPTLGPGSTPAIRWLWWQTGFSSSINVTSTNLPPTNEWSHVAFVYTHTPPNNQFLYYLNGSLIASNTANMASYSTTGDQTWLGRHQSDTTNNNHRRYNGSMSDVRVYTRVLSGTDVANLHAGQHVTGNLLAHWRLDEGSGTTATDSSANNHNGTVANSTWLSAPWTTTTSEVLSTIDEFDHALGGLNPDTEYQYYAAASWDVSSEVKGWPVSFTTTDAPVVETLPPEDISNTSSLLKGEITSLGGESEVNALFRWREKSVDGLSFNGSNTRVDLPHFGTSATDVSVSMWINPAAWSTSAAQQLLFWGQAGTGAKAFEIAYRGDTSANDLHWFYWDGSAKGIASTTLPPTGEWSHLAFVYEHTASTWRYYLNGSQITSGTATSLGAFSHAGTNSVIGQHPTVSGGRPFNGDMSDVRIYTRVLSATDVEELHAGQHVTGNLIAHWKLDDGAGSTATDSSGNGRDGIVANGTWISPPWTTTDSESFSAPGVFNRTLSSLSPGTEYHYYAAVAWGGDNESRGLPVSFVPGGDPPVIQTDPPSALTGTSATLNGTLTDLGATPPVSVSVYWGTTNGGTDPNEWHESYEITADASLGPLSHTVSGLTEGALYYYRFAATDDANQTAWGDVQSFQDATNTWIGSGNASVAANWSLGLPLPTHHIRLDDTSPANMTWDGGANTGDGVLPDTVASWTQIVDYTGTVTIKTTYPEYTEGDGALGFTNLIITGDATIQGGTWTHQNGNSKTSAPWDQYYRLRATIGGDLTIDGTAAISAAGRGFNGGRGPGGTLNFTVSSIYRTSASHGGFGSSMAPTYGSVAYPTHLGSGGEGGNSTQVGTRGGGAVYLAVGGLTTINTSARIDADGASITSYGTGSGGSVLLRTGTLAGSGMIRANGGTTTLGDVGAGGRVAILLEEPTATFDSFNLDNIQAFSSGPINNAAGTVYLQTGAQTDGTGTLVVKNNNGSSAEARLTLVQSDFQLDQAAEVVIKDRARLGIHDGNTFVWADVNLTVDGINNSFIRIEGDAGITYPGILTISGFALHANGMQGNLNSMVVEADGLVTAPARTLALSLPGNLTVKSGGQITMDNRGYGSAAGPGAPLSPSGIDGINAGGSYGGQGGSQNVTASDRPTYGSFFAPDEAGSGGKGHNNPISGGGGLIVLTVDGTTHIESGGFITANANEARAAGSGGGIFLTTGSLTGSGTIRANGGAELIGRAGGGGGRIAVILTGTEEDFDGFSGVIEARANPSAGNANHVGGAGSVYLQDANTAAGAGVIRIDNNGKLALDAYTDLPPAMGLEDDLSQTTFEVSGSARLRLTADASLASLNLETSAQLDLNGYKLVLDPGPLVVDNVTLSDLGAYTAAQLQSNYGFSQIVDSHPDDLGLLVISDGIPPEIATDPPQGLTTSSATLAGTLASTGSLATAVDVYWGLIPGGQNASGWDQSYQIAAIANEPEAGLFTHNVGSLIANRVYYYRFAASNENLTVWADLTERFMTGEVSIEKISDASEIGLAPGSFRFYRHADATNGAITVHYARDAASTAFANINFEPMSGFDAGSGTGTIVLPEGQTEAILTVVPLVEADNFDSTDLILNLVSNPRYLIDGDNASATLTVSTVAYPDAPTNTWIGSGNASVPANWSLGIVPDDTHDILLDYYSTANLTWDYDGVNALAATVVSWTQTDGYTGTVTFNAPLTITQNADIAGGIWTHPAGSPAKLDMTVGGNLTVHSGARIDVNRKGFSSNRGPGSPDDSGLYRDYIGGSYGGIGARGSGADANHFPGPSYGSILAPTLFGSGGGGQHASGLSINGQGGGAILLDVAGITTLASGGFISANAHTNQQDNGGAGGSILLLTGSLTGGGTIQADGGTSGNPRVSGGGGRVAVSLRNGGATFDSFRNAGGVISAYGGQNSSNGGKSGPGTVFLRTGFDYEKDGRGTIEIKSVIPAPLYTPIPPAYDGTNPAYTFEDNLSETTLDISAHGRLILSEELFVASLVIHGNDARLNLNGRDLHVRTLEIAGTEFVPGTYTAAELLGEGFLQVVDDPGADEPGRIVVTPVTIPTIFRFR